MDLNNPYHNPSHPHNNNTHQNPRNFANANSPIGQTANPNQPPNQVAPGNQAPMSNPQNQLVSLNRGQADPFAFINPQHQPAFHNQQQPFQGQQQSAQGQQPFAPSQAHPIPLRPRHVRGNVFQPAPALPPPRLVLEIGQVPPPSLNPEGPPGWNPVTSATHRHNPARGPINKETGQALSETLLVADDGFQGSTIYPRQVAQLTQAWSDNMTALYGPNVQIPAVVTVQQYAPIDGNGSILSRKRPSFATPSLRSVMGVKKHRKHGEGVRCSNPRCDKDDHILSDCVGPPTKIAGDIYGCPECNTTDHPFDDCHKVTGAHGTLPLTEDEVFILLIVKRLDKPQIRSNRVFSQETHNVLYMKHNIGDRSPWTRDFAIKQLDKINPPWQDYNYSTQTPVLLQDPSHIDWAEMAPGQAYETWKAAMGICAPKPRYFSHHPRRTARGARQPYPRAHDIAPTPTHSPRPGTGFYPAPAPMAVPVTQHQQEAPGHPAPEPNLIATPIGQGVDTGDEHMDEVEDDDDNLALLSQLQQSGAYSSGHFMR
ncbi:hypothetical protein TruAng_011778 [Truncatella angustata]|nr:hypothetical protein TruAng_011778 [Truncatella angustata]